MRCLSSTGLEKCRHIVKTQFRNEKLLAPLQYQGVHEPPVEEPCGVQQGVAEEKLEHYFFVSQSEIGETFVQREMIIF